MKPESITPNAWRPSQPTYLLAALMGMGIFFIGVRFLLSPFPAAEDFGVPLADVTAYAQVKAVRDIFSGLLVGTLLLFRDRRLAGTVLLVTTWIPFADGLIVLLHRGSDFPHLAIHWGTALMILAVAAAILRKGPPQSVPPRAKGGLTPGASTAPGGRASPPGDESEAAQSGLG